jgi:NADPH-dependent curcumin reductase CurA
VSEKLAQFVLKHPRLLVLTGAGLSAPRLWRTILVIFLTVRGFIIANHWDLFPEFIKEVGPMVADGTIAVKEDITDGLENAPQAFIAMLTGGNTGKAIVKIK